MNIRGDGFAVSKEEFDYWLVFTEYKISKISARGSVSSLVSPIRIFALPLNSRSILGVSSNRSHVCHSSKHQSIGCLVDIEAVCWYLVSQYLA